MISGEKIRVGLWSFILMMVLPGTLWAQCNNWSISAHLIAASSCAGNGSSGVTISGPDAANITNLQYGIPLSANGFSVPLNNSSTFSNIPAGAYPVSVVGTCSGNFVGKTSRIVIPGSYTPPGLTASVGRNSINCGAFGQIYGSVYDGKPPYSLKIISAPASYSGPVVFNFSSSGYGIRNLPLGNYVLQATDYCNNGTVPLTVTIGDLDLSTFQLNYSDIQSLGCDTLIITKPDMRNTIWQSYQSDTLFKISAQVGSITPATAFANFNTQPFIINLPPGKTLKDYYGQVITYNVKSPCGTIMQFTQTIPFPAIAISTDQNCNINFKGFTSFTGVVCTPVTYSMTNTDNGTHYGPYISGVNFPTSNLPIGNYSLSYTTGDGYSGTGQFGTTPITGNPYHVSAVNKGTGLNNYITEFDFYTSISTSARRTIELFSGPAGYSYSDNIWVGNLYIATSNQTPTGIGKVGFPAGNYVWRITDPCGTYLLPITVGPADLYQYTIGIGHTRQACEGLWIFPTGTATSNGQNMPFRFDVSKNGGAWSNSTLYNAGDSFLVSTPGVYTIIATSADYSQSIDSNYDALPYPNSYTVSYAFTYSSSPVTVDLDNSQGFLCKGSGPGQGLIYVKGKAGMPYLAPVHYNYYLAQQGNAVNGPYLATNTTGIFTNFGGNANDMYDVKVQDSCGAFAVQTLKILDLQHTRLISSSSYTPCVGATVNLTAIELPGATYSWTGPGGFTSSVWNPVITNVGMQNIGIYRVTIITPQCMLPITDSTIITANANPPKPIASLDCNHDPVTLTITNPVAGYKYQWYASLFEYGDSYGYFEPSDTGYTKYIYDIIDYRPVASDTGTGCTTYGDSIFFSVNPNLPLHASVYSPHLSICPGDTTILLAQGATEMASYQWFKNDTVIPGATYISYVTSQPGNYKVYIQGRPCKADTSANVTVSNIPIPVASTNAPVQEICAGDTANIYANQGVGYTYTWLYNDSTVPANTSPVLSVTRQGSYKVIVSNGGCIAIAPALFITVDPKVVVNLLPATKQVVCTGDTVHFNTVANTAYAYTWLHNGNIIPGAAVSTYNDTVAGTFTVTVKSGVCPVITSSPVVVNVLVRPVASITASKQEICMGDTAFLYANTDTLYTYKWLLNNNVIPGNISPTLGATQQGTYTLRIFNGGCTAVSQPVSITVDPAPIVNLQPGTDQFLCTGDILHFTTPANATYTYTWQKNGVVIPGATGNTYQTNTAGTYQVSVQAGVCAVVSSQPVAVTLLPVSVKLRDDTVICSTGPFTLILSADSGFAQVLWSTGETTNSIVATHNGTYIVQATNQCGVFTDSMHIYTPASYAINLPADTLICNKANSAAFSVPSMLDNIRWSNGITTPDITITRPGTYWVQATSPCGSVGDTTNVHFCVPIVAGIELDKDTICEGDCINISARVDNYPQQFIWSCPGAFPDSSVQQPTGTVCYSKAGIYPINLAVENAGGTATAASQVVVLSKPVPRFADTTLSVPYKSDITLSACADALTASWYLDDSLVCSNCQSIDIDAKYYYNVYHCVVSNGGCKDSCIYKLQVVDIPHDLWLPDAFTPNGDGKNDIFHIITDNPNVLVVNLELYNRWGQLLYISRLNNEGWDGTFHGVPVDMGTYYWMLKYKIVGGSSDIYFKKGSVELIR